MRMRMHMDMDMCMHMHMHMQRGLLARVETDRQTSFLNGGETRHKVQSTCNMS